MTLECLESFLRSDYDNAHYIVVDNGSTDGTEEAVRKGFPDVKLVVAEKNLGVAGGYNLGIKASLQDNPSYVLVTNNDVIVAPDMLTELVYLMDVRPEVGMMMPKIYHFFGRRDRLWCTGARWRRFPPSVKMIGTNARDSRRWSLVRSLEFAPSCTLMIRAQVLKEVGGFDEDYFFYNDDWDFSLRVRDAGYEILYNPSARLWHKVSISTQKSKKPERWWRVLGSSTSRFYVMHVNRVSLLIYVVWFVVRELAKGKPNRILPFVKGVCVGLRLQHDTS